MKLPLNIRNRLFSIGFQVKGHGLMEVPSVALSDIALASKMGLKKSIRFVGRFNQYRRNLGQPSWSCLTALYPRANYMTYYYLLFWWADYCDVLIDLLATPSRSLIAELFFRYIIQIDKLIDTPEGRIILSTPSVLKTHDVVEQLLEKIFNHIENSTLTTSAKRDLYHEIWTYRHECLLVCQQSANRVDLELEQVLLIKKKTTGGLFRVWAFLLTNLYCNELSQELAKSSQEILSNACMAMQVFEDMLDFPEDHENNTLNIFHEILKRNLNELAVAERYLNRSKWKHLDFIWAEEHLPFSYEAVLELSRFYLQKASKSSLKPLMTGELSSVIGKLPTHPVI